MLRIPSDSDPMLAAGCSAAGRGIESVRTYADAGKSGLRLDGRDALKQLIADVEAGAADFETILVYDVSRWGRFQDADETAYYEYLCKPPVSALNTAPSNSKTTVVPLPTSSRASSGPWQASTAVSSRPRLSLGSAGSSNSDTDREVLPVSHWFYPFLFPLSLTRGSSMASVRG